MSTKAARGIKRTCQNSECNARFYDLGSNPIVCPICGTTYQIASAPLTALADIIDDKNARKAKKSELLAEKELETDTETEADEALVDIEEAADIPADDDTTFLADEEEEGGDVTNIIGGPVAEGEEET